MHSLEVVGGRARDLHAGPHRTGDGHHARRGVRDERSEEHTSELQSQSNLVCRLLLEKKNTHFFLDSIPAPRKMHRAEMALPFTVPKANNRGLRCVKNESRARRATPFFF